MTVNPLKKTCSCGREYEALCNNSVYCPECKRLRHNARCCEYQKTDAGKETRRKANAKYYQKHRESILQKLREQVQEELRVPRLALEGGLIQRPCDNGCGAMVTRASRQGRTFCQKCREEHRRASKERYRQSEKGKAQQKAAYQRFSMNEEAKARKAERAKERREERQQLLQGPPRRPGRKPQPKPLELETPAVVRPKVERPKAEARPRADKVARPKVAKVQEAPARRLPTEEEKLLMLRAAMKRYYGN